MTRTSKLRAPDSPALFRKDSYKVMPWKNGRGKSAEIAIEPPDAIFPEDTFVWRLSSASIMEGGPFSKFPGYERFLTLVTGRALELGFADRNRKTDLSFGDVYRFSGDDSVVCELPQGPVTDLNLIFQKGDVDASFEIIQVSSKPRSFQLTGQVAFVFVVSGTLRATLYPGEKAFALKSEETLRVDTSESPESQDRLILLESVQSECVVAVIEIDVRMSSAEHL